MTAKNPCLCAASRMICALSSNELDLSDKSMMGTMVLPDVERLLFEFELMYTEQGDGRRALKATGPLNLRF